MIKILKFSLTLLIFSFSNYVGWAQTADMIRQMGERDINNIEVNENVRNNRMNGVNAGLGTLFEVIKAAESANDLYNDMNALDNNECVPDFETSAADMMPTGCIDNEECAPCYERAISRISTVRKSLARMSCINMNTKKFTESAIAFGDDVSGIHGVTGLAWHAERKGIQNAYDNFKKTYDKKYIDLMASLQTGLREIDECEKKFGMKDWYQKAGFMYMEMMKEKYKRTD